jgi:hypothetical protein
VLRSQHECGVFKAELALQGHALVGGPREPAAEDADAEDADVEDADAEDADVEDEDNEDAGTDDTAAAEDDDAK